MIDNYYCYYYYLLLVVVACDTECLSSSIASHLVFMRQGLTLDMVLTDWLYPMAPEPLGSSAPTSSCWNYRSDPLHPDLNGFQGPHAWSASTLYIGSHTLHLLFLFFLSHLTAVTQNNNSNNEFHGHNINI